MVFPSPTIFVSRVSNSPLLVRFPQYKKENRVWQCEKEGESPLNSEVYLYRRMCSRFKRVCKVEKEMCNIVRHFEGIGKIGEERRNR